MRVRTEQIDQYAVRVEEVTNLSSQREADFVYLTSATQSDPQKLLGVDVGRDGMFDAFYVSKKGDSFELVMPVGTAYLGFPGDRQFVPESFTIRDPADDEIRRFRALCAQAVAATEGE